MFTIEPTTTAVAVAAAATATCAADADSAVIAATVVVIPVVVHVHVNVFVYVHVGVLVNIRVAINVGVAVVTAASTWNSLRVRRYLPMRLRASMAWVIYLAPVKARRGPSQARLLRRCIQRVVSSFVFHS